MLLYSALIGCAVGALGTGMGAMPAIFIRKIGRHLPPILMGMSGGIMLAIVLFDMFPYSMHECGILYFMLFTGAGAIFVMLLFFLFEKKEECIDKKASFANLGIMLMISIAIHNFPEGLAIGAGLEVENTRSITLALLLFIHNIPEGLAIAIPLKLGGFKNLSIILITASVGLPTALGAVIGSLIGGISHTFVAGSIAFAAGAMLYITVREIIPESLYMSKAAIVSIVSGLLIGIILIGII